LIVSGVPYTVAPKSLSESTAAYMYIVLLSSRSVGR
jgi:hypothetical protein